MNAVLVILLAASMAYALSRAFRLPHVPMLILSGGLLDYVNAPLEPGLAKDALLLGLTFLVFLSGSALNPWSVNWEKRKALLLGVAQFATVGLIGYGLCLWLEMGMIESVYLSLAVASSSTLVIIKILQSRSELFEPFGRLLVGALLVQDLLMIILISALSRVGEGELATIEAAGLVIALFLICAVFKKWIAPWLLLSPGVDEELQLVLALGILFLFVGIAEYFRLPFMVGAFLAGLALSSFPINGLLKGQFASLNNFFSSIFFVTLGYFVNMPPEGTIGTVILLSLLIIVATPIISVWLALSGGLTLRTGVEAGLLLAQASEFSIILALVGLENRDLGQGHLSMITSITVLTMIATPFLTRPIVVDWIMGWSLKLRETPGPATSMKNHCVFVGCGESCLVILKKLLKQGHEVFVIDDDPGVVKAVEELGSGAVLGDGKDPATLKAANIEEAKLIVSSMRKVSDNETLFGYALGVPKVVRVFDGVEAQEFDRMGGVSIPTVDAASADLLTWIEKSLKKKEALT